MCFGKIEFLLWSYCYFCEIIMSSVSLGSPSRIHPYSVNRLFTSRSPIFCLHCGLRPCAAFDHNIFTAGNNFILLFLWMRGLDSAGIWVVGSVQGWIKGFWRIMDELLVDLGSAGWCDGMLITFHGVKAGPRTARQRMIPLAAIITHATTK